METESEGHLAFLDLDIYRRPVTSQKTAFFRERIAYNEDVLVRER
jgi:hypothetical protein